MSRMRRFRGWLPVRRRHYPTGCMISPQVAAPTAEHPGLRYEGAGADSTACRRQSGVTADEERARGETMQGTPHNVDNIPPEKDDKHPSKETEEGGSAAAAPEAPTGPPEGKRRASAGQARYGIGNRQRRVRV